MTLSFRFMMEGSLLEEKTILLVWWVSPLAGQVSVIHSDGRLLVCAAVGDRVSKVNDAVGEGLVQWSQI